MQIKKQIHAILNFFVDKTCIFKQYELRRPACKLKILRKKTCYPRGFELVFPLFKRNHE